MKRSNKQRQALLSRQTLPGLFLLCIIALGLFPVSLLHTHAVETTHHHECDIAGAAQVTALHTEQNLKDCCKEDTHLHTAIQDCEICKHLISQIKAEYVLNRQSCNNCSFSVFEIFITKSNRVQTSFHQSPFNKGPPAVS